MLTLNLGCGINRLKFYSLEFQGDVIHLDKNPDVKPDVVWDLNRGLPTQERFGSIGKIVDSSVDEIHAYHIIEHIGKMGDTEEWFRFWHDCWKALKPYGKMYVITPYYLHEEAVGDPTHTRLMCRQSFSFLDRKAYEPRKDGTGIAMSQLGIDFDLPVESMEMRVKDGETIPHQMFVILTARKNPDGGLVQLENLDSERPERKELVSGREIAKEASIT